MTPLIAAAISNQAEVVEKLIEANADVSFVGPAGITALHMAAEHGNVRMIKALLAAPGGEAAAVLKEEHGLKPVEVHRVWYQARTSFLPALLPSHGSNMVRPAGVP